MVLVIGLLLLLFHLVFERRLDTTVLDFLCQGYRLLDLILPVVVGSQKGVPPLRAQREIVATSRPCLSLGSSIRSTATELFPLVDR